MKNITLIPALTLAFTTISLAQMSPGDVGYNKSNEALYASLRVSHIHTYQTNPEFGNEEFLYTTSIIDTEGKVIEEKFPSMEAYFSDDDEGYGDDSSFIYYAYLPNGAIAQITSLGFDLSAEETYFTYDANGRLQEKIIAAAEARKYTFEFDKNGNIIKANGQMPVYTDSENGTPIDILKWMDADYYLYKWNEKNQLTEQRFYYRGELYSISQYSYEGSKLSSIKIFTDEKSKTPDTVITFSYNTNSTLNKMIVVSNYSDSRVAYRYDYEYY